MKNTFWNKRIPTLFGLGVLIIGIFTTTFLVRSGVIFESKASPAETPKNIRVTNISATSFTVSYITDASVIGSINFGKDKNFGLTALDERDPEGKIIPHVIHHLTLKNLAPKTSYFFDILSGQNTFLNNSLPFEVTTGETIREKPSSQSSLAGNVILPDAGKLNEGIVYAALENGQTISALIKENGSFSLPLSLLRTANLSSYFPFSEDTVINLLVTNGTLESHILLSPAQTTLIPTITLSYDYDFTVTKNPIASRSGKLTSFPSFTGTEVGKSKNPEILTPKKDQKFSDQRPLFKGTATPLSKVQIIIRSLENIQTEVTTDAAGSWTYRPQTELSPGSHTISIIAKDPTGILKTITQNFTVFAQGSQVLPAVPTGSPTPAPTLSLNPTTTPTPTLIPTPTSIPIPTVTPTVIEEMPTLPPTGNSAVLPIGIAAAATALIGIILFFLTHGIPL